MTSALNVLMNEIHFKIPREILDLAFNKSGNYRNPSTTIDDEIATEVLRKKVMVDLNLASQEQAIIPLSSCECIFADTAKTAFFIPKTLTEGRSIVSVHNMLSGFHLHGDSTLTNHKLTGSTILDNAMNIMNSLDNVNIRQTSRIDLIGENTILIDEGMLEHLAINVTVVLENETNLNNINPKAFKILAEGCVLAVKWYIYNSLIIQINKGVLYAGHELSIIKDIIDEYKDLDKDYDEWYETKWKKVAFMQNDKAMDKYIGMMMGNTI